MFFLIDFWIDFLMDFEDFGKQKSLKNAVGVIKFESFCFLLKHQFLINFWSILRPKMEPKTTKNRSKKHSKNWLIFWLIFYRFLDHFWCHVGLQNRPKIEEKWVPKQWPKKATNMRPRWANIGPNKRKVPPRIPEIPEKRRQGRRLSKRILEFLDRNLARA